MIPAFLITFREVIEASLIVATILGILVKLRQGKGIKTVWVATGAATVLSFLLLGLASLFGLRIQEVYTGKTEELIEGLFMMLSAIFITWAVFFLHKYFANYKVLLLQKVKQTVEQQEQKGLFLLVFTAVFREGFEIVLFLSTIYFSSNPQHIFTGFSGGIVAGLLVSFALFSATLRMPVYYAFRVSSVLLVLFAAGLLARGIGEFIEAGVLPELSIVHIPFLPMSKSFGAEVVNSIFGLSRQMSILQVTTYIFYIGLFYSYMWFKKAFYNSNNFHP